MVDHTNWGITSVVERFPVPEYWTSEVDSMWAANWNSKVGFTLCHIIDGNLPSAPTFPVISIDNAYAPCVVVAPVDDDWNVIPSWGVRGVPSANVTDIASFNLSEPSVPPALVMMRRFASVLPFAPGRKYGSRRMLNPYRVSPFAFFSVTWYRLP